MCVQVHQFAQTGLPSREYAFGKTKEFLKQTLRIKEFSHPCTCLLNENCDAAA